MFGENQIYIFSDGACKGNPGPGGWGSIILYPPAEVMELAGRAAATTNNQMEIRGTLEALRKITTLPELSKVTEVHIHSDSVYLLRGATQWIWGWIKRGWLTAEGQPVSNKEMWIELQSVLREFPKSIKFHWHFVRGHVGIPSNERCDEIAVTAAAGRKPSLYRGSLLQYPIALLDLPEDMSIPEMKSPAVKVAAYSYLSYVNGVAQRHADWKSCEARVKGASGAKFKKAQSAADEAEILSAWGAKIKE
jgi:ribonuclease HI